MSETSRKDTTTPVSLAQRIDRICNGFEDAWKAGQPHPIENYLVELPYPEQAELLRELLRLEWEYRTRSGQRPACQEYRARFEAHAELVDACFRDIFGPFVEVDNPLANGQHMQGE